MRESQNRMILDYLKEHGSINKNEARTLFSCDRLSARIFDIKEMGYEIGREDVYLPNKFGRKCKVSIYYMEAEKKEADDGEIQMSF